MNKEQINLEREIMKNLFRFIFSDSFSSLSRFIVLVAKYERLYGENK